MTRTYTRAHRGIFAGLKLLAVAFACGTQGYAQIPGANQAGVNAAMIKLFGPTTAFSSKAQVQMLDKAEKETMSMPMNFALLDAKIRLEVDLTQLKSKDFPPQMLSQIKQMGMSQLLTIVRPDKKSTIVIYPALRAYAEMGMSSDEVAALASNYKVEKSKLGTENIDGHSCEKNKVTVTDGKGTRQEAVVWNATDLTGFPVQMRMSQPEATVVMHFTEIQLARPDAKQFEPPTGFTKHDSMEKLVQAATLKMQGGK